MVATGLHMARTTTAVEMHEAAVDTRANHLAKIKDARGKRIQPVPEPMVVILLQAQTIL